MKLPEEKVKQLIALMNSTTEVKIPPMRPIIECYEIAIDDERVLDFLLRCGDKEYTLEELKTLYGEMYAQGRDNYDAEWERFWAGIYDMSFMIPGEEDHSKFLIASIFPGWIELSVSGPLNEKRRAIINRFMDFWQLLKKLNIAPIRMLSNMKGVKERDNGTPHMGTLISRGSREIALNQPLTSEQQVLSAGDAYSLLEKHKDEIAVMNCICRTYKEMNGGSCDYDMPIEGCMNIGPLSRQLVKNGISRAVSYEEACALIEEFERKGCIHTTFHYGGSTDKEAINICNCCNDCCLLYGGYQQGYLSKVLVKSFFSPKMIDETRCVGCNKCGQYCATGATYYDKAAKKLVFDYDMCVGCGQCVTQCAFDVREMVRDERNVFAKTKKKA
ncbi:MAG: DUF362 domain-containing protein [Candidatus Heteroscillospira sp.]|jgi:Pyruvate/2-oxoacid:ferredoxin oxidoreductase delta subunit